MTKLVVIDDYLQEGDLIESAGILKVVMMEL